MFLYLRPSTCTFLKASSPNTWTHIKAGKNPSQVQWHRVTHDGQKMNECFWYPALVDDFPANSLHWTHQWLGIHLRFWTTTGPRVLSFKTRFPVYQFATSSSSTWHFGYCVPTYLWENDSHISQRYSQLCCKIQHTPTAICAKRRNGRDTTLSLWPQYQKYREKLMEACS